jgi:hypothetical protein
MECERSGGDERRNSREMTMIIKEKEIRKRTCK